MTNPNNIYDNSNVTANSEQIAVLKKHFPNCFDKEGRFLINNLKDIITKERVDTSHEGYKLDWLGKSYARLLANEKPRTLIAPNKEHNTKDQNKDSNNLLIKGDNLEVLKHLKNAYAEAVKVIYIDPPYNTGSDGFVYQDDRKFSKEELANLANVSEEDAERILNFTDKGSNSHSAWLTFIYPRLYVARELLQEDGVIFISIDDNEQAQLKMLCDEVFSEDNFITTICHKARASVSNDKIISENHNYILLYAKDFQSVFSIRSSFGVEQDLSSYNKLDDKGKYKLTPVDGPGGAKKGNPYYSFHGIAGYWRYSQDRMQELYDKGEIIVTNKNLQRKTYLEDTKKKKKTVTTWWDRDFLTSNATRNLSLLMNGGVFTNPKSLNLLNEILTISSNGVNDFILDFFAGSGTTAHAVMELNAEDGGNRQYIMVQLPEETDQKSEAYKAGYKSIFDITKARIEKAAEKIKAEKPDYKGDLGFKIFETVPLPQYYDEQIDKLTPDTQGKIWDGSSADDSLLQSILTSWTLYDRILLTTHLQTVALPSNNYKAYYGIGKGSNTLYLMHKGFTIDNIKDIIDKLEKEKTFTPDKIVVYGHNFDSKTQRELSEAMLNFKNKKQLEIEVVIRY